MTIKTWKATQFSKRKNSTKVPGTSPTPTSHTVRLKDPTSVINPTIIFEGHISPADVAYARIDDFGRYYFVNDIRYNGPNTEIDFVSDPMASFKTDIGSYDGHIVRCSDSGNYRTDITDPFNTPTKSTYLLRTSSIIKTATNVQVFSLVGCYLLTVAGDEDNSGSGGATCSYYLTQTALSGFISALNAPGIWSQIMQQFSNPMDSLISCKYVPIDITSTIITNNTTAGHIYLGTWDSGVSGRQITGQAKIIAQASCSLSSSMPTGYLRMEPYCTYSAILPFVGVVPIDFQNVVKGGALDVMVYLDLITCDVIYEVLESDSNHGVAQFSGNFGTELPVSSRQYNASGVVAGGIAAIGGAIGIGAAIATGGAALPAVGAMAAGVASGVSSLAQHTQINGSMSSSLSALISTSVVLNCVLATPASSILAHVDTEGLPCHKQLQPIFAAGYLQYLNPSVVGNMTAGERDEINSMMASGFYYE